MAKLEAAHLGSIHVHMALNGAVAVPELSTDASSLSPTESVDSALGDSPRPGGNSGKYLSYGGPGFSVASFDAVTGSVDRIPVPLPLSAAEVAEFVAFPQSPILCMTVVGEEQVWVGTEAGSLHVFELEANLRRFSSHAVTTLDGSVLCIASRPSVAVIGSEMDGLQSLIHIDVLLGLSNGAVSIITGETTPNGGLKNASSILRKPRKVIHLGRHVNVHEDEEEGGKVNCIAAVHLKVGGEVFWCSYGRMVVVVKKDDGWDEIGRLDGLSGHPKNLHATLKDSEIVQIVVSEHGIWTALSNSTTLSLWDTDTLEICLTITCCALCDSVLPMTTTDTLQITALHFSSPFLLVGTSKGDLIVFRVQRKGRSSTSHGRPGIEYKVLTAEHCSPSPIRDIFATTLRTEDEECRSLSRSSLATPTSLQVLVVCGQRSSESSSDVQSSLILFYELLSSPSPSPLTSPLQLPSLTPTRPLSTTRCSSIASNTSTRSAGSTIRRRSMGTCAAGSLPKLSFYSASPMAHSLLPLRSS